MTALLGMVAVLVDGGLLFAERRHAQATADAAALAAASDLYYHYLYYNGAINTSPGTDRGGTAAASAKGVASANGYTNDGTSSSVTVNIPPASGNFIGKAGYAEVIVTWYQRPGFSQIFGTGSIPVSARAVAQGRAVSGASGSPAILLLGSSGTTLSAVVVMPPSMSRTPWDTRAMAARSLSIPRDPTRFRIRETPVSPLPRFP